MENTGHISEEREQDSRIGTRQLWALANSIAPGVGGFRHVARRLDSKDNNRSRNPSMLPMQGASRETQQSASEGEKISNKWIIWAVVAFYFGLSMYLYWHDDEGRLNSLNILTSFWQTIARFAGNQALRTERAYFDYAELLH